MRNIAGEIVLGSAQPCELPVPVPPAQLEGLGLQLDWRAGARWRRDVGPFRILVWQGTGSGLWYVALTDSSGSDHWLSHVTLPGSADIGRFVTDLVEALGSVVRVLTVDRSPEDSN